MRCRFDCPINCVHGKAEAATLSATHDGLRQPGLSSGQLLHKGWRDAAATPRVKPEMVNEPSRN